MAIDETSFQQLVPGVLTAGADAEYAASNDGRAAAVAGFNKVSNARGFLAGGNPLSQSQPVGAYGEANGLGVFGFAKTAQAIGVAGNSADGAGIGVQGHTSTNIGVWGDTNGTGIGIVGQSSSTGLAGKFIGNVEVTGNLNCHETSTITCFDINLIGGDCAEAFDIASLDGADPGTVMVIDKEGALVPSNRAYDRKVVGVISGAGAHKPGIILDKQQTQDNRLPIALIGKVYCKVDAQSSPVEVGDLLTTSPTPGHAMRATDPLKAFGAVIGKALRPLDAGQGLIPILIALQ